MLDRVNLAERRIFGEREVGLLREWLESPTWGGPGPEVERFERGRGGVQTRDDLRWGVA